MKTSDEKKIQAYLKRKKKSDLIDEIVGLARANESIEAYYIRKIRPPERLQLEKEKYKERIREKFVGHWNPNHIDASGAIEVAVKYQQSVPSPEDLADLLVYCLEVGLGELSGYGGMEESLYDKFTTLYETALEAILETGQIGEYSERCRKIVFYAGMLAPDWGESLGVQTRACFL